MKAKQLWFCAALLLCLLLSGCTAKAAEAPAADTPAASGYTWYHHPTHGYTIRIPADMQADTSLSEIVTAFENDTTRIEIYRQDPSVIAFDAYVVHGNQFLKNTADHREKFQGTRTIGTHSVYQTWWFRDGLNRIEGDKNHYITYDIKGEDAYYTIFVQSAYPIADETAYDALITSFRMGKEQLFSPTVIDVERWHSQAVDPDTRSWNGETARFYKKRFGEKAKLRWGIFQQGTSRGDNLSLYALEEKLDYSFDYLLCYSHYYKDPAKNPYVPIKTVLETARRDGKTVELTLLMNAPTDKGNDVYDILKGEYDAHLHQYARQIAEFGHPVLFRLNNEMNTDWCYYSAYFTSKDADIYKEVYRYIHGIFEEEGANANTIWVWNPNGRTFPNFSWNHMLCYYPGDEYVDVVGITGYNTGTYHAFFGERWEGFMNLYGRLYREYGTRFAQPFMLTEFSCATLGGDKVAWVEEMFAVIEKLDRIKAAVWWDHVDYDSDHTIARDYRIDQPPQLIETFKSHLNE